MQNAEKLFATLAANPLRPITPDELECFGGVEGTGYISETADGLIVVDARGEGAVLEVCDHDGNVVARFHLRAEG